VPDVRRLVATTASALALVAGVCGGGTAASTGFERVHFRASDGVVLDGRLFGSGKVGIVLSHSSRRGSSQAAWLGTAQLLAGKGYRVLTYDRRGVCPGGADGCSSGVDPDDSWKDIVGAAGFLRREGAERIVLGGAALGAMDSLYAASAGHVQTAAVMELAGITDGARWRAGYSLTKAQIAGIGGWKLFLSATGDFYGGAEAARLWYGWAKPPKRLALVPSELHGTDLLGPGSPVRARVQAAILAFLAAAAPPRR
jgi:predicted alpha/beta hydrolase